MMTPVKYRGFAEVIAPAMFPLMTVPDCAETVRITPLIVLVVGVVLVLLPVFSTRVTDPSHVVP